VVTYHRVLAVPDELLHTEPDVERFREQLTFLLRHFRVLPLGEALAKCQAESLPKRALAITFDDGYSNNFSHALPVLQSLGVPATVFVATGYLNGGCMWNDTVIEAFRRCRKPYLDLGNIGDGPGLGRFELTGSEAKRLGVAAVIAALRYRPTAERSALATQVAEQAEVAVPTDLMLKFDEVRGLRRSGVEIGGHTVNHPILARIPPDEAWREIDDGAAQLQGITGERPKLFAYPNGRPGRDFTPQHETMVRDAGFSHAFSTAEGICSAASDPYAIPRISLWQRSNMRLTANLMSLYARSR